MRQRNNLRRNLRADKEQTGVTEDVKHFIAIMLALLTLFATVIGHWASAQ